MTLMKAIRLYEFGGPDALRYEDLPVPEPALGEVLVRVHGTSVNPVDGKTREGVSRLRELPLTLGWDVAGVVAGLGAGVDRFSVGDEVLGLPRFPRSAGAYAEYVTAPAQELVRKPPEIDMVHAGCLPLSGLTAWQALVTAGSVGAGRRVLIHAAAGGVGHLAVQIAKARGAYVLGTAAADSHEALTELGADELIDYRTTRFEDAAGEVDVVLDLIGGENSVRSLSILRAGGVLVSVPAGTTRDLSAAAADRGARWTDFLVHPDAAGLDGLAGLVRSGELRVVVCDRFALADTAEAHRASERPHDLGKIAITP
ncbi:NADP-dependent oxidoreductase [Pseudonocardia xinjiangensis]|uniref:NADP-dependent oxidoreductase n=1 Tax=Pseudonocardia xinjiangensis TaxID=75289 RepID=UPI003D942BA8